MNWTEIVIHTATDGIDAVTGTLMQLGINGFVIEDKQDFKEFLRSTCPHWDYVDESLMKLMETEYSNVKLYVPENSQGAEMLTLIRSELNRLRQQLDHKTTGSLTMETSKVCEADWENNWKKYFKPFNVGSKLLIKPSWEHADNPEDRKILEIDPGSSFGTGQHYTTKLCLENIERVVKDGDRMLDLGCGSGILSIAGILLGAKSAYGVDIDENAVKTAKENAMENGIDSNAFDACTGDAVNNQSLRDKLCAEPYDIVCANIVADVIIALAPYFGAMLKNDGRLLVSGIIEPRLDDVMNNLSQNNLQTLSVSKDGGWAAIVLTKVIV